MPIHYRAYFIYVHFSSLSKFQCIHTHANLKYVNQKRLPTGGQKFRNIPQVISVTKKLPLSVTKVIFNYKNTVFPLINLGPLISGSFL